MVRAGNSIEILKRSAAQDRGFRTVDRRHGGEMRKLRRNFGVPTDVREILQPKHDFLKLARNAT